MSHSRGCEGGSVGSMALWSGFCDELIEDEPTTFLGDDRLGCPSKAIEYFIAKHAHLVPAYSWTKNPRLKNKQHGKIMHVPRKSNMAECMICAQFGKNRKLKLINSNQEAREIIVALPGVNEGASIRPVEEVETIALCFPGGKWENYKLKSFTYLDKSEGAPGRYVAYVGFAEQACNGTDSSRLSWLKFDGCKISRIEAGIAYHRARRGAQFVYHKMEPDENVETYMEDVVDKERAVVRRHANELLAAMCYIVDPDAIQSDLAKDTLCGRLVSTNWGLKTDFCSEETAPEVEEYVLETHCTAAMWSIYKRNSNRGAAMTDALRLQREHMKVVLDERRGGGGGGEPLFFDIWRDFAKRLFDLDEDRSDLLEVLHPNSDFVTRFLTLNGMAKHACFKCRSFINNNFLMLDCKKAVLCGRCIRTINVGTLVCPSCNERSEGGTYYHNDTRAEWVKGGNQWMAAGSQPPPLNVPEPGARQMQNQERDSAKGGSGKAGRKRARPGSETRRGGDRGVGTRQRTRSSGRAADDGDDDDFTRGLGTSASHNHGTG